MDLLKTLFIILLISMAWQQPMNERVTSTCIRLLSPTMISTQTLLWVVNGRRPFCMQSPVNP